MRIAELSRLRWLLGTLLVAAAALFALGIATEGETHGETVVAGNSGADEQEHNEQTDVDKTGERVLGVNLESTPLVVLAVAMSSALAAATWRRDDKRILLASAVFAAVFATLDVAEFSHQIRHSAPAIAAIAAIIAMLHAGAALLAEQRRTTAT